MSQTRGSVIGIDPGERWIGIARAAQGSSLALPVGVIDRSIGDPAVAVRLSELMGGELIAKLVVGVPLRPDGLEDEQAARFRRLGESLADAIGAECVAQDERHSSASVTPPMPQLAATRARGKSREPGRRSVQRQRRERERSHADAAARILQRWLDARDGSLARDRADAET